MRLLIAFTILALEAVSGAALPAPVESCDAGTLHVDRFGAGATTLVLIPGLGGGAWVWEGTIAKFGPGSTMYVITLAGFDGRAAAAQEKSLCAAFSRDFWKMLQEKKIRRPIVIGHSLGGTLAIALAEEHPQRLAGIVAVDGLPVFPTLADSTATSASR